MNMKSSKKVTKAITSIFLALAICISMVTPVFAATQTTKIGTNNYSFRMHQDDGLKPCFATEGYCMTSVWGGINTTPGFRLTPSAIPEIIEGYPVVCMRAAYLSYSEEGTFGAVTFAPEIPKYMQDMERAFVYSQISAPPSKIPDMVSNLKSTFAGSKYMNAYPLLGRAITDMSYAFNGCINAAGTVKLPVSVKKMSDAFTDCKRLTEIPDISHLENLIEVNNAFRGCVTATGGTNLPDSGLKSLDYLFYSCAKMAKPPSVIPKTVTTMRSTFNGCQSLTGTIDVRACISADNAGSYSQAFAGATTSSGCALILNYTAENESAIDDIIKTKVISSNIIKGALLTNEVHGGGESENPDSNTGLPTTDGTATQDVVIRGVVEPINTIDVDIPLNLTFTINENRNIFYTKGAKITSNSPAPLVVSSLGVTVPSGAPKLVADDTFPDWDRLTMAQTKNNLAVSINGTNLSVAGGKLGDIDSGYHAPAMLPLQLSVLYGKLWPNTTLLTFDYIMNLEIALAE